MVLALCVLYTNFTHYDPIVSLHMLIEPIKYRYCTCSRLCSISMIRQNRMVMVESVICWITITWTIATIRL